MLRVRHSPRTLECEAAPKEELDSSCNVWPSALLYRTKHPAFFRQLNVWNRFDFEPISIKASECFLPAYKGSSILGSHTTPIFQRKRLQDQYGEPTSKSLK